MEVTGLTDNNGLIRHTDDGGRVRNADGGRGVGVVLSRPS